MSRSVSSREVRLHDQDELDCALPCESFTVLYSLVKCREVTVKKKRVETFRKIYGMVTVVYNILGHWGASSRSSRLSRIRIRIY